MHTVDRPNAIVTHDSGNPRDQTLTFFEALAPRGYLGWGKSTQLGTGLGVALGAKLAFPDKLVRQRHGRPGLRHGRHGGRDGGARAASPIMTVLLNNSVMGGYGHHMPIASERFSSNQLSGDYAQVAEGLGAYAERVERPDEVVPAIQRAIAETERGRPAVLEIITKEEPIYPSAGAVLASVGEAAVRA